jgi:hypothetical protein
MLVLLALLEHDQLPGESQVGVIAKRCERIAQRYPLLREELATTLAEGQDLTAMIKSNALRAWAGTKKNRGSHFFALNGDTFRTTLDVPTQQRATFVELVQELVAWRLAAHLDSIQGASFECRVTHNRNHPILMLPDRARFPLLPQGDTVVVAEAERFVASFAKIALNTMQREGGDSQANALPEVLRFWFGDDAGRPGNDTRVRFVAMEDGYEMTPVVARAPEAVVQGPDKSELDAHFCVETLGQRAAVIYRSRGGAKGSEDERNSDYTPGLDTLLERAKSLKLVLADALLDTVKSKQLSLQERRLNLEGAQLPLPLEAITDTATVRRWIAKAQREHGGNETRQLRLVFESADKKPLLALDLARHLAGNA